MVLSFLFFDYIVFHHGKHDTGEIDQHQDKQELETNQTKTEKQHPHVHEQDKEEIEWPQALVIIIS